MVRIILKKGEEKRILDGHSWVYANEVKTVDGKGGNGEICSVHAADGRYLGKGFLNHFSKILVRILTRGSEEIDRTFFLERLKRAKNRRRYLNAEAYRAVFAEADGLPGLIVDCYGDVLSVQFLCLGMEKRKEMIVDCLQEVFSPRGIYERSDVSIRQKEGLEPVKGALYGDFSTVVRVNENGILLDIDVENGQKTGYFLDQKENRCALRRYCKDAEVLDVFSNVGGFALNAAKGGAKCVTALDISPLAVEEIQKHAKLNGFSIETVCADAFETLRTYRTENRLFDVIILDPPAFCKTADKVNEALRGYRDVNIQALKLIRDGGILCTGSCSQHVSPDRFETMLAEAAKSAKCQLRILEKRFQSPDHPILLSSDESLYLKFYIVEVTFFSFFSKER